MHIVEKVTISHFKCWIKWNTSSTERDIQVRTLAVLKLQEHHNKRRSTKTGFGCKVKCDQLIDLFTIVQAIGRWKDSSLLRYEAALFGKQCLMFQWIVVPLSLQCISVCSAWLWRWRHHDPLKCCELLIQTQHHVPEDVTLWQHCCENTESGPVISCWLPRNT